MIRLRHLATGAGIVLALSACAAAADWPQFRGPNRDGVSGETGLMKTWPKGGPEKLWESSEIGLGWSSLSVVGGTVYTSGLVGREIAVTALAPGGKRLWQTTVDKAASGGGFRAARSTPTVDGDRLYLMSCAGKGVCLDRASGKVLWSVNLLARYKAENIRHALAESPLVDLKCVYFTTGGRASMVALDKVSGKEVWAAKPLDAHAAYASARIVEQDGLRMIVSLTGKNAFGVRADDGKVLWSFPRETPWEVNINSLLYRDGILYCSNGYKIGTTALKLTVGGDTAQVKPLWTNRELDDFMGGTVLAGKALVGTCHEQKPGLVALDAATGKTLYKNSKIGESSVLYADGRLYVSQFDGTVMLVDPANGRVLGSLSVPYRKRKDAGTWAHPALSDGKLYYRHESTLTVYDIQAR